MPTYYLPRGENDIVPLGGESIGSHSAMKPAFPDSALNVQEQSLPCSLVIRVDSHGLIREVNGGLDRLVAAQGQELRLPETGGSCFDFFARECEPRFEGAARWSQALKEVLEHQSQGVRIESYLLASVPGCWIEITLLPLPVHDSAGALITCIDISSRKQAALELRHQEAQERTHHSEATMAAAQRISHFGSWELDLTDLDNPGRNALRWSDEIFRIFGHEVDGIEASNENFFRAVHPDDREMIRQAVSEAIRTHGRYSIDHRIILPQGNVRHIHEDAQIFLDEQTGQPLRMVGTAHDITERKLAEEVFKTSELRFRHAFANASVGFAITDMGGIILHINKHYCQITGYAENEMIGRSFASITHPDDGVRKQGLNQKLIDGEIHDFIVEKRYLCKNGEVAWVENSVSAIRDASGVVLNMVVLCKDITESRHNQEQLRLLETCVAHLSDIVLVTEPEPLNEPGPRIVFVNDAFTRHTGYTREETLGRNPRFLQGPATDRFALGRMHAALAQGLPSKEELINYKKDGSPFCVEIDVVPITDASGRPTHFVAVQRDITARKEAADRLWQSNLRYERQHLALARMIRGGVMQAVHLETAFRLITEEIAHAMEVERVSIWRFDQNRSSIVCQVLFEAGARRHSSGPELQGRDYPTYFRAMAQNETIAADDARNDPRTREFTETYLSPLGITSMLDAPLHVGGVLAGVLCHEHVGPLRTWLPEEKSFATSLAHFISLVLAQWERRQVEDMLRQQASLLDKANDAILVRDLDHSITYWNKSAELLYGWTAEEAKGRKISELLYIDRTQFEERNSRVLAEGEWAGEIQQVTKTGEELTVEGRWTLVRDAEGRPKCVLAINTNITEQKRLEDQILRSQRMESIGTLAGGIAHDLNNVLTPIMMSVDLLNLRIKDADCRATLETIASSARRGADMLNQVLSFARGMEGQKMRLQISRLLQDLARIVGDTFPKNIQLRTHDELLKTDTVSGDPTQIHQVLLNLCVNARDAMPAGGTLTISAANILIDAQYAAMNIEARGGPHIMISVEDDGVGIASEILPKIFDPFFTTKEMGKGTGLGLSTSLAIMKSHGGFFRVYSELGHGSCFRVYLPAQPAQVTAHQVVEEQVLPRGNNELVLFVDDEAAVREITRQTLEAYGYRVLLAADGAEAVTLYSKHQNDIALVLTDMRMPVMDGTTTIQVLMKMNPEVCIIAASGINSNNGVAKAAGTGVRQFLPKPYTAETILRALHNVLHEH